MRTTALLVTHSHYENRNHMQHSHNQQEREQKCHMDPSKTCMILHFTRFSTQMTRDLQLVSLCVCVCVSLCVCLCVCLCVSLCLGARARPGSRRTQALKPCLTSSGRALVFVICWFPSNTFLICLFEPWRRQAWAFASLASPEQSRRIRVGLPTRVKPHRMSPGVLLTCSFPSKVSIHLRAVSQYLNNRISKLALKRSQLLQWISYRMVWFSTSLLGTTRSRFQRMPGSVPASREQ